MKLFLICTSGILQTQELIGPYNKVNLIPEVLYDQRIEVNNHLTLSYPCERPLNMVKTLVFHNTVSNPSDNPWQDVHGINKDHINSRKNYMAAYHFLISPKSSKTYALRPIRYKSQALGDTAWLDHDQFFDNIEQTKHIQCFKVNQALYQDNKLHDFKRDPAEHFIHTDNGYVYKADLTSINVSFVDDYRDLNQKSEYSKMIQRFGHKTLKEAGRLLCELKQKIPTLEYIELHHHVHHSRTECLKSVNRNNLLRLINYYAKMHYLSLPLFKGKRKYPCNFKF